MSTNSQNQAQLLSQVKTLLEKHESIGKILDQLKPYKKKLPKNIQADLRRISNAAENLVDLLQRLKKEIPKKGEDESTFWSRQRHDLRTPLNGIKNYTEMVLEEWGGEDDKKVLQLFMDLLTVAEQCLPLIDILGQEGIEVNSVTTFEEDEAWHVPEGGTILIIDDNPDNREVLKRRLEKANLSVLEAANGYEGLRAIAETSVDLILLDIMMPGLNGYEVLDRLKSSEAFGYIPVLMISSVSELSSIVRCIEAGADDYLPTPFNPILLKARISSCLDKKRHTDKEKAFMQDLETAQKQLEAAIESIDEGFAIFDASDTLIRYNAPFKELYPELFEFGPEDISFDTFLRENLANGTFSPDRRLRESTRDWINRYKKWHQSPTMPMVERIISRNIWIEIHEYKTPDGGTVSIHKDISQRKAQEEHLSQLALHDGLTGLANRTYFEESLNDALEEAQINNSFFSILFFDLDGFKEVNDTFGHEFGDKLLVEVSHRLKACVRSGDLVSRLGGDEFSLILPDSKNIGVAEKIAKRALERVAASFSYEGETAEFGVSIGIASYPHDGQTSDKLLKAADKAMYAAKKAGKGQYRIYSEIQKAS